MNVCHIIGNMCNEPELRCTKDGKSVTKFTVAVNWMDGQGTDYFNVSAWERRAEICAKHLHKGDRVAVSGTISVSSYLSPEGKHYARLELRADRVEFLARRILQENTEAQN